jgi:NAD-dependent dihydropyrimidine dehydrogenase PreA subunit
VTLTLDTRDCVGCGVCVARCPSKIFELCNDKSFMSVRRLADCTLCKECEIFCPVRVIHMTVEGTEEGAAGRPADAKTEPESQGLP